MARKYARRAAHRMTPARRAALKKAQLASAKKRSRRRKIAYGVAGVAAGGTAAYVGYKHSDKITNIAGDMKRRTPTSIATTSSRVRAAFQPVAKEATRMRTGLTKGFHRGAGPNAGQQAVARPPRPSRGITDADRAAAAAERERLKELELNSQSMVFGEGPASRKDEDGNGKENLRGIPKRSKLSGRRASAAIDRDLANRAALGAHTPGLSGRRSMMYWMRKSGQAYGRYRPTKNQNDMYGVFPLTPAGPRKKKKGKTRRRRSKKSS